MSDFGLITMIEQQVKNNKRYNLYINEKYAFSVHEDILIAHQLYKGKEIDNNYYYELMQAEEKNKLWQKALRYLSIKSRSTYEVQQYLTRKGFEEGLIREVLSSLQEKQFLNDELYSEQFINARNTHNPKGKKLLAYELKRKGINSSTISSSLLDFDEEKELELAKELVNKKNGRNLKDDDWAKTKAKLARYLERRGFSYHTISKALEDIQETEND